MSRHGQLYCCSQAYDELKDQTNKIYRYNKYNLIHEFYYLTPFPPPLSLVARLAQLLILLVIYYCCGYKPRVGFEQDHFSKYSIAGTSTV